MGTGNAAVKQWLSNRNVLLIYITVVFLEEIR